ncbi:MAG TPA: TolC family protein [Burkholderiaceae bacterium]|nr:TolC family protein [Burkholderiaceae bacterium]
MVPWRFVVPLDRLARWPLWWALALATLAWPAARAAELGADLESLLTYARAQNPELAAMRSESEAAAQRVQPAGALPDPVLRVELMNINNYGNDAPPSLLPSKVGETKYTFMQAFPLWGKRDLRRDVAGADAQRATALTTAAWNELATKLKTSYAQYYLAAGSERITLEVVDLLSRLERLAQARYAGGLVAQQDAIRAQLERTAVQGELIVLDTEKRQARVRLNTLLAREVMAPLAEPSALRALPAVSVLDAASLAQRARSTNPALAAEEARLRSAQSSRDLVLKNRYPDINVGIAPTQMGSRITTWELMLEVNIPLQQESRRSQESEAEAMISAQRSRAQAAANQLLGELGENLAAFDSARRWEGLATTQLMPQSELSFRSALAAYEAGKVDFATLLDAQRQIRKARQDHLKAQVEAQLRLAEVERIVGEDL